VIAFFLFDLTLHYMPEIRTQWSQCSVHLVDNLSHSYKHLECIKPVF